MTHSSTLAWKILWTEEPGRLQSMESQRVRHDWVTSLSLFTFMRWRRKWQPTPVLLAGESQGRGSLVGYSPRCGRIRHKWAHEWMTQKTSVLATRKLQRLSQCLQCPCKVLGFWQNLQSLFPLRGNFWRPTFYQIFAHIMLKLTFYFLIYFWLEDNCF